MSYAACQAFHKKLEKNIQAIKSLGFYRSGEPEIKELLDGSLFSFAQISPLPWSFFLVLDESHQDREIEWRGLRFPKHVVLLLPLTTHFLCILQRFWPTLSHVRIYMYSSQKRCLAFDDVTGQLDSSRFLGHGRRKGQFHGL